MKERWGGGILVIISKNVSSITTDRMEILYSPQHDEVYGINAFYAEMFVFLFLMVRTTVPHNGLNVANGNLFRFMPLTVILIIIISFPSPTHFISRLKTFLFCKSFPLQPFLFFFMTDYMDSSGFYCYF